MLVITVCLTTQLSFRRTYMTWADEHYYVAAELSLPLGRMLVISKNLPIKRFYVISNGEMGWRCTIPRLVFLWPCGEFTQPKTRLFLPSMNAYKGKFWNILDELNCYMSLNSRLQFPTSLLRWYLHATFYSLLTINLRTVWLHYVLRLLLPLFPIKASLPVWRVSKQRNSDIWAT